MKPEIILQIVNISVTFIIGVVVALHLGKFDFNKKRREILLSHYITLNKSLYEFQHSHQLRSYNVLLYVLLNFIRHELLFHVEQDELSIGEIESIFNNITGILSNNRQIPLPVDKDFYPDRIELQYRGENPHFHLMVFLLNLNKKERNKVRSSSVAIKKELLSIENNYEKLFSLEFLDDLKPYTTELKAEAIKIINNMNESLITLSETSDELLFAVEFCRSKIYKERKSLFRRNNSLISLTNDYEQIFLRL